MNKYIVGSFFVLIAIVFSALGALPPLRAVALAASATADVWWPTQGAAVSDVQPFKAMVEGIPVEQYDMYWQVDGGALNPMQNNYTDSPHKEASVDLSGWHWHGSGPYVVTFVAKQNGAVIAQQSVSIMVDSAQSRPPQPAQPQPQPAPTPAASDAPAAAQSAQTETMQVWWPTDGADVSGVQPFKAVVANMPTDAYTMYWQVGGGALNEMQTNDTDSPHKEASVDLSGWHWEPSGHYVVTFVAKNTSGAVIAQQSVTILANAPSGASSQSAQSSSQSQSSQQTQSAQASASVQFSTPVVTVPGALAGAKLYVDPDSDAATQAASWRASRPQDAAAMDVLAAAPTAVWFGDWNSDIQSDVHALVSAASAQSATPVLVAYDIPERDCGSYSQGGAASPSAYASWIKSFAQGIGDEKAVVILEPDALADLSCLSESDAQTRLSLLSQAVATLKANPNTSVYIDAGHSDWVDAPVMANSLKAANIAAADGFALDVSNFETTANNTAYGTQISDLLGGAHFVIDTGRNGDGSDGQWCNPSGRALGQQPTTSTGNPLVDAYLWIKTPGESDGNCNGGPAAGVWWPDYALELVHNAGL